MRGLREWESRNGEKATKRAHAYRGGILGESGAGLGRKRNWLQLVTKYYILQGLEINWLEGEALGVRGGVGGKKKDIVGKRSPTFHGRKVRRRGTAGVRLT